jgi:uncharacterized protein YjiS (DUF1127 family)
MPSLHHVVPAAHRSANASAGVSAATAHQFQNDPITVHRLLSQMRAQLGGAWQVACLWKRRHTDRAVLRSLSPREIRDFCPRQAEAEEEMNKPFWRA